MSDCSTMDLSITAIVISGISFALSAYLAIRDRGDVTASARYPERFKKIFVHVVNSGRRPVTLRHLIVETQDGARYEYKILNGDAPIRLMESEDHEFPLPSKDTEIDKFAKTKVIAAELEDSRGKKYVVKDLANLINNYATDRTTPI